MPHSELMIQGLIEMDWVASHSTFFKKLSSMCDLILTDLHGSVTSFQCMMGLKQSVSVDRK